MTIAKTLPKKEQDKRDREAIETLIRRASNHKTLEKFAAALLKKTPLNRFQTEEKVLKRVAQLGFSIPEFEKPRGRPAEVRQLIANTVESVMNDANPPKDIDALKQATIAETPQEHVSGVTKQLLFELLYEHYFKLGQREQLLNAAFTAHRNAEQFLRDLKRTSRERIPPAWVVAAKFADMHGRTRLPQETKEHALPGILRMPFADVKERALPQTTFEKPYNALPESGEQKFNIAVIAAPKIGLPFREDIAENLVRCGFSAARKLHCDALILGGGLFEAVFQKTAGTSRLLKDLVLGNVLDIRALAKHYQTEARRIVESGSVEPIYMTAAERFAELLRGWYKACMRPVGKPEFTAPVYIVLAPDDLAIVRVMAYFELLYQQHRQLEEARAAARYAAKVLTEAKKQLTEAGDDSEDWIKEAEDAISEAQREFDEATELVTRTRMTNLDAKQDRLVYERALSYLIEQIEEKIPNAVVVDQNRAYMKFGKSRHVFRFVSAGDRNSYYAELSNYGPSQRAGLLPDMTVVMHPSAVYFRKTARQNYKDGKMLGEGFFVEAPTLIDRELILERTRGQRVPMPVVRAVSDPMWSGGMLIVTTHPELGVDSKMLPLEFVRAVGKSQNGKHPAKMLWIMEATDSHIGGAMRVRLTRHDGTPIGITETALELMKRSGIDESGAAHVHMFLVADDILHGNHYGTERRIHYIEQSTARVLQNLSARLKDAENLTGANLQEHYRETTRMLASQLAVRVPHLLTGQMLELTDAIINPYKDVFGAILLRAQKSRVIVRGISEYTRLPDMRDLGIINFGSGNHATKTTEGMFHEGLMVAEFLRQGLKNDPDLAGLDMERLIRGFLFQDQAIGYGTVSVDNKFTYGLHFANTPPKRDSWLDVLHGWVEVNRKRGNPSTMLNNMPIVHITGDKHFCAACFAGGDLYVMGPAATHTDSFAELAGGLPENNSGVAFIGLPIEGPDSGPIHVVHLTPTVMQEYIGEKDKPFPWNDLLPNRA